MIIFFMQGPAQKQYSFYYKGQKIQLLVCEGSLQTEIIDTLKTIFKINSPQKLLFMQDDGKLIVLSSALPNKTKLTIVDGEYQFVALRGGGQKWIWKKDENAQFLNETTFRTPGSNKVAVYGDIKMKGPGKYWWRVKIQQIWCCQELGITKSTLAQGFCLSKPQQYHQTIGFPGRFPGFGSGPGDTGCNQLSWKNHIFYLSLDFKESTFKIVNETLKIPIQDVKVTFEQAVPYFFSNKHSNLITLIETGHQK